MRHGSLFNGIGGFQLAAAWMGWENVFSCEIDKFCNKVTKYHFPNCIQHEDIRTTDFSIHRGSIDIITGGFPCQPFSTAGKRKGKADERHLWPEMLRAIREVQPGWVVGENVPGLLNWERGMVLDEIKTNLEAEGFEVFPPLVLPACGKDAPHRRDRLWVVASAKTQRNIREESYSERQIGCKENGRKVWSEPDSLSIYGVTPNANCKGLQRWEDNGRAREIWEEREKQLNGFFQSTWEGWPTETPVRRRNDGLPNRVDRIKALGNAVVPQVVYEIFKAIELVQMNEG